MRSYGIGQELAHVQAKWEQTVNSAIKQMRHLAILSKCWPLLAISTLIPVQTHAPNRENNQSLENSLVTQFFKSVGFGSHVVISNDNNR